MRTALWQAAFALFCITQPAQAQQDYRFLQRDNPFGQAEAPQGGAEKAFCWSDPGSDRIAYVTELFAPKGYSKERLESLFQQARRRPFTCEFGQSPQINNLAVRTTSGMFGKGATKVERLNVNLP
jgi:hypothetical protein